MSEQNQHLEAIEDIRRMMNRSSRFISLSGLSGIAAGICALIGAYFAYDWIHEFSVNNSDSYSGDSFQKLKLNLILLGAAVVGAALVSAFYFTWRRANKNKMPIWDHSSKMMIISMMVPFVTGGLFILAMLQYNDWRFVAPCCLIFYGLALVNGGRYTLSEIKYLGYFQIIIGLISTQFIGYGLYFWVIGFGILHIIYGLIMWMKYERKSDNV
jgi:hypothetical protein